MAGIIKSGTSVEKSLLLPSAKTWQHNRGVKPLRVTVVNSVDGQPLGAAQVAVTLPTDNAITLTPASALGAPIHVFVDWDITSLNLNSLEGAYGTVPPSYGFV